MSRRSDSSSEADSSCCNKSDGLISIISIDSNITDSIIRKVINVNNIVGQVLDQEWSLEVLQH